MSLGEWRSPCQIMIHEGASHAFLEACRNGVVQCIAGCHTRFFLFKKGWHTTTDLWRFVYRTLFLKGDLAYRVLSSFDLPK